MSPNRKDLTRDRSSDQNNSQRSGKSQQKVKQTSKGMNRNEERITPRANAHNAGRDEQRHLGSGIMGTEPETSLENPASGNNRTQRTYTGNSERSGQQYSIEGNSSQGMNKTNRTQNKNQQDRSGGSFRPGEETNEGRQRSKGMNAPGMKQKQETHQHYAAKDQRDLRNKQDDLSSGDE